MRWSHAAVVGWVAFGVAIGAMAMKWSQGAIQAGRDACLSVATAIEDERQLTTLPVAVQRQFLEYSRWSSRDVYRLRRQLELEELASFKTERLESQGSADVTPEYVAAINDYLEHNSRIDLVAMALRSFDVDLAKWCLWASREELASYAKTNFSD